MTHPAFTDEVTRVRRSVDNWGEKDIDRDQPIACRVMPTSKTMKTEDGKTLQLSYKIVTPADVDFVEDDLVKINDRNFTIRRVEESGTIGLLVAKVFYV